MHHGDIPTLHPHIGGYRRARAPSGIDQDQARIVVVATEKVDFHAMIGYSTANIAKIPDIGNSDACL